MRLYQSDIRMYHLKTESEDVHSVRVLKFVSFSNIRFRNISIIFIIYQSFLQ